MKKQVVKKSISQLQSYQLNKNQLAKLKGGEEAITEIVIIDVITP